MVITNDKELDEAIHRRMYLAEMDIATVEEAQFLEYNNLCDEITRYRLEITEKLINSL